MLALIFVHALHLHVKDAGGVYHLAGYFLQVFGKGLLVVALHFAQALQHRLVGRIGFQLFQLCGVLFKAIANGFAQKLRQRRVRGKQPAAVGNAVGDICKLLRAVQEVVVEHALLDDVAVQL